MASRRSLTILASLALGALVVWILSGQPSPGQSPTAPPQPQGRYQMQLVRHGGDTSSTTVFICDTHTGHVWYRETLAQITEWTDMASPAPPVHRRDR